MKTPVSTMAIPALALGAVLSVTSAQNSEAQNSGGGAVPADQTVQGDKGQPAKPAKVMTGQAPPAYDQAAAKNQPLTATGEDLTGSPVRFPPSKTPE